MHRTNEKTLFAGVAAALVVFLVMAAVALWHVSKVAGAWVLGVVFAAGVLACLLLMGTTWLLARRDWSGREETRQALHAAEDLNARMIEGSTDGIAVLDALGRLKSVNSTMWRWIEEIGLDPIEDMNWIEAWAGEPRVAAEASMTAALNGSVGRFQALCHLRSGEGRWYDVVLTPVPDRSGATDRIQIVSRDVTASHDRSRRRGLER